MQCSVYIAVSVDGFIARSDGRIDWLSIVERPGEDYGYRQFYDSVDAIVVGRKTYDLAAGFETWPYAGKRCIVMTHAPSSPRHDEEFFQGPPEELVARLSAEGARRAYVDGGSVVQQFLRAGLVTDMTLSIIPILLGEGVRLFGSIGNDVKLRLVRTKAFESGLVQIEYTLGGERSIGEVSTITLAD